MLVVTDQGVVVFDAGGSPVMGESVVAKIRSVTDKAIVKSTFLAWKMRFTRGDPFPANRFHDYVAGSGHAEAAYSVETSKGQKEVFWLPPLAELCENAGGRESGLAIGPNESDFIGKMGWFSDIAIKPQRSQAAC